MDSPIRTTVSALTSYLVSNLPGALGLSVGSVDSNAIQGLLSTYVALYSTAALPLTAIQPDYEANVAELQNILNNSPNPAWNNTAESSTGQTLIEMIATGQAFNQFSVERGLQESMLDYAQLPSSIYTITRMLGVRITRSSPASLSTSLVLPMTFLSSITIPAYSQFNIGGIDFYNDTQIIFPANTTTQNVTFYQGTINTATFYSNGQALQTFSLTAPDFSIADQSVVIAVNGTQYQPTTYTSFYATGLWEYGPNDKVFYSATDASGNATITFGDGNFGAIPPVNAQIVATYAVTLGSGGNITVDGQTFNYSTTAPVASGSINVNITGTCTSNSEGGLDQRQAAEYKTISPGAYSAKDRPSTVTDYNSFALNYSGVIDAQFTGQANFAPTNLNYMMVVKASLLTQPAFTTTQFQAFATWLQGYSGANIQFIQEQVSSITVNVSANVFCTDQIPLTTLQNLIISNLTSLFTPRAGYLGYSIYMSDIVETILSSDPNGNIQYVQLLSPGQDQIISTNAYLVLGTVNLNMQISNRNSIGA